MLLPLPIALIGDRYERTEYVLQLEIQPPPSTDHSSAGQGVLQNNVLVELDRSNHLDGLQKPKAAWVAQNDARSTLMVVVSTVGQCIDYTCSRHG